MVTMITVFLSTMGLFLARAIPAFAVQTHADSEGLFSHQLGHILFLAGMAYMLFRVHRFSLQAPGWRQFRIFLWLIILWNIQTFAGHWLHSSISPDHFTGNGGHTVTFRADCLLDWYFYFSRFDHLLLVPAFFFLFRALKRWSVQV
ncbi:hypothetical protein [Desulfolithobacter sp.]